MSLSQSLTIPVCIGYSRTAYPVWGIPASTIVYCVNPCCFFASYTEQRRAVLIDRQSPAVALYLYIEIFVYLYLCLSVSLSLFLYFCHFLFLSLCHFICSCFSLLLSFFLCLFLRLHISFFLSIYILGASEITASLNCNCVHLYWKGCVICSIYLR